MIEKAGSCHFHFTGKALNDLEVGIMITYK